MIHKHKIGMALHFANVVGHDKKSIVDRLIWVEEHGTEWAKEVVAGRHPSEADSPYQAIVAAHEWLDPGAVGIDMVCHMDGTCNGLQHGAALTGHRETAYSVNCTNSDRYDNPQDVYGDAHRTFIKQCKKQGIPEDIRKMLKSKGRVLFKYTVMVTSYGAGEDTAYKQIMNELSREEFKICEPHRTVLLACMNKALLKHAGAIIKLANQLKEHIKGCGEQEISWIAADGFPVFQNSREKGDNRIYRGAGKQRTRIDGVSEDAQIRGIAPNFVHTYDGCHFRYVVNMSDKDIVGVHDSYGIRSIDFVPVYKTTREAFVLVHQHDQAMTITIGGVPVPLVIAKYGDYESKEVLNSPYFFL